MKHDHSLPQGFQELEPFVADWACTTSDARWVQRSRASMEDIQAFYDAMFVRAEAALAYLEQFELGQTPPAATRLANLLLMLGQVAIAVEMHQQPRAPYSPYPHDIRMISGPWPLGR